MRDHQLGWTIPAQPLGEAIKPEKPVKVCEFREFDSKPHRRATHPDGMEWYVYEEDCRQIKGAAQAMPASDEVAPSARPDSPVAAPPQSKWTPKVGEKVKVISCDHSQPLSMLGCVGVVAEFDDFGFFCLSFQEPENRRYRQWFNPTEVEPIILP